MRNSSWLSELGVSVETLGLVEDLGCWKFPPGKAGERTVPRKRERRQGRLGKINKLFTRREGHSSLVPHRSRKVQLSADSNGLLIKNIS